ncbi:hypothetical protein ABFS83_04G058500 [Erythranthe nasuta]
MIMLKAQEGNPTNIIEKLVLIDTLERLGLSYHFDQEIESQLQQIFVNFHDSQEEYDLFTTALGFRLLRQHRHRASSSVFDKFKGEGNKSFRETLESDGKGLLSLYEAAHLRIHGEQILDEALAFTTHHLNLMLDDPKLLLESPLLVEQVKRALQNPLHRGVPRIEARHYISLYEKDELRNDLLLKLAKLDFNYVQNMHKQELSQLSRWWKELDLMSGLSYARARLVEGFVWASSLHFEPQYSSCRIAATKIVQMLTLIDDTYDNYATLEEADLFTTLFQRWSIDEVDEIPDCMVTICRFSFNIYAEHELEAAELGKSFAVPYAIQTVKEICSAYNKGLKWGMGRNVPTFEEYMMNTVITSCLYVFSSIMIPGMESVSSKETIDWLMSQPQLVIASAKVCRLMDDLGSYQRERKEGKVLTGVDFYMKQHGASVEETTSKFVELIEDGWKELNREWMNISENNDSIPKDISVIILNYARVADSHYRSGDDGFAKPQVMSPHIAALYVEPLII